MNAQANNNQVTCFPGARAEQSRGFRPLEVLIRRRWQLSACLLLVCSAAFITMVLRKPHYEAKSRVEIVMDPSRLNGSTTGVAGSDYFSTQCQLLHSRYVLARAAEKLNEAGEPWSTGADGIKVLEKSVKIEPLSGSRLIDIVSTADNGATAAAIANQVAAAFLETSAQARRVTNERIIEWVNEQIENCDRQIESQEENIRKFRQEHLITGEGSTLAAVEGRITQMEERLTQTQMSRLDLEIKRNKLQNMLSNGRGLSEEEATLSEIKSDPIINSLNQKISSLQQTEAQLAQAYLPGHEKLRVLRMQIADLQTKLLDQKAKLMRAIFEDTTEAYAATVKEEETLMQLLDQQRETGVKLAEQHQIYQKMLADLELTRRFKTDCIQKLQQFTLDEGIIKSPVAVVDPAPIPTEPAGISKAHQTASILILGAIFSIGLVFMLERFTSEPMDNMPVMMPMYIPTAAAAGVVAYPGGERGSGETAVSTDKDIAQAPPAAGEPTGAETPFLGRIDRIELGGSSQADMAFTARCHIVQIDQSESHAEIFRGLGSTLLRRFGSARQSLVVTSGTEQCGKTICACNLAITLAQAGRQVLLVEGNLESPALHRVFSNTRENPGLVDVLTSTNPDLWEQAIQATEVENLSVIGIGQASGIPVEQTPEIAGLHQRLKNRFEWIIYDASTVEVPFTETLLQTVGKSICVSISSEPKERVKTIEQIELSGAVNLGVIENDYKAEQPTGSKYTASTTA